MTTNIFNGDDWKGRMEFALRLFNDNNFVRCIAECRCLLLDGTLSTYYQIHCHALIAAALDDWYEAEEERAVAENLWNHCRIRWPTGVKAHWDELMDELRGILDDLAEDMEHDRPVEEEDDVFIGHIRSGKKKISRDSVAPSASDTLTSNAASVAEATAETAFPVRNATTLTTRSHNPTEEGGVTLGYDAPVTPLAASADSHNVTKEATGIAPQSNSPTEEEVLAVGQLTRSKESLSKDSPSRRVERWGKFDWGSDEKTLSQ